jgi:mRNA interferase YafQ
MQKRGKNMNKIFDIIASLVWNEPLPERCREHKLHGDWDGFTECHIEGDWVMIYITDGIEKISFSYTGTHSDYL